MARPETLVMEVCWILKFRLFSKICEQTSFCLHVHSSCRSQRLTVKEPSHRPPVWTVTSPQMNAGVSCLSGVTSSRAFSPSLALANCHSTPHTSVVFRVLHFLDSSRHFRKLPPSVPSVPRRHFR